MPVARIARIGKQDRVVAIHEQCQREQQRSRRSGGDDDALRRNGHIVAILVVLCDGFAKCRNAERGRVVDGAAGKGLACRRKDWFGCRKIGFADFHVHDRAAAGLQRTRRGLHFHDVEGRDVLHSGRGAVVQKASGIHRTDDIQGR